MTLSKYFEVHWRCGRYDYNHPHKSRKRHGPYPYHHKATVLVAAPNKFAAIKLARKTGLFPDFQGDTWATDIKSWRRFIWPRLIEKPRVRTYMLGQYWREVPDYFFA